jgi:UTP--glucose-1-phosphate uridylyltransferase
LVLFGDDIIDNPVTAAEQLVKKFSEVQAPVIATIPVSDSEVSSYGIVEGGVNGDTMKVSKFLEKPKASETTSRFAAIGKYVLTPDIFEYLEKAESSVGDGEIRLADAFIAKNKTSDIYALQVQGSRYDTGSKAGYLKACIAYAMKDESLGKEMKEFMKQYL